MLLFSHPCFDIPRASSWLIEAGFGRGRSISLRLERYREVFSEWLRWSDKVDYEMLAHHRPLSWYFRAIRETVAPHLRTYPSLKVWIAGCSSGEELYSFVIMFREEGLESRTLFYATDINQSALTLAESGVYGLDRIRLFTENHRKSGGKSSLATKVKTVSSA